MSEDVNVVAEEGIDKYTVNFLKEVLEKNDRTMNLSEDIVSGKDKYSSRSKESGRGSRYVCCGSYHKRDSRFI